MRHLTLDDELKEILVYSYIQENGLLFYDQFISRNYWCVGKTRKLLKSRGLMMDTAIIKYHSKLKGFRNTPFGFLTDKGMNYVRTVLIDLENL